MACYVKLRHVITLLCYVTLLLRYITTCYVTSAPLLSIKVFSKDISFNFFPKPARVRDFWDTLYRIIILRRITFVRVLGGRVREGGGKRDFALG